MTGSTLLENIAAAAAAADFQFISTDENGDEYTIPNKYADAEQAFESLSDPGEGWVRIDDSAWGLRQANPETGYVRDGELQAAIRAAINAGLDEIDIVAAIEAGFS